jgi:hypothetical protein
VIEDGRARHQSRYRKPQNEWKVLLVDHHPGYISWEEYWENKRRLQTNLAWGDGEGSGAPKVGSALLSGLLRCGRCGRKLQVVYSGNGGRVPRYSCRGDRGDHGSSACLTIGSLRVDRAVVRSVLAAIQPAGIEAAVRASECAEADDDEKRKALELALERSRYEANRARRQFDAVDPENRLVAGELEARWNHALEQVAALETRVAALGERSASVSEGRKAELMTLGDDVWMLWDRPNAPVQLKKRTLRTVINEIVVQSERESPRHRLILHWAGGVHTELSVERNPSGQHRRRADRTVIELVSELANICPDRAHCGDPESFGLQDRPGEELERFSGGWLAWLSQRRAISETGRLGNTGASSGRTQSQRHGHKTFNPRRTSSGNAGRTVCPVGHCSTGSKFARRAGTGASHPFRP